MKIYFEEKDKTIRILSKTGILWSFDNLYFPIHRSLIGIEKLYI